MSKTQTLPRSWEFKFNSATGNWCLVDDTDSIRHLSGPPGMEKTADMRAIEALPELLAVCQRMLREIEFGGTNATAIRCMIEDAKAALAKVGGGIDEQPGAGVIPCDQDGDGFAPADPYR